MSEHTKEPLSAWSDDTALMGPEAPQWDGSIEYLIRYLLTVHKRFGNTAVTANLKWGASALWKRDEQANRIATLEQQNAELVEALKKIEAMDYGRAAINMYGRLAHEIATEALAKVKQP